MVECFRSNQRVWRERLETRGRHPAHVLKTWDTFERYWQRAEADFGYPIEVPHLKLDIIDP